MADRHALPDAGAQGLGKPRTKAHKQRIWRALIHPQRKPRWKRNFEVHVSRGAATSLKRKQSNPDNGSHRAGRSRSCSPERRSSYFSSSTCKGRSGSSSSQQGRSERIKNFPYLEAIRGHQRLLRQLFCLLCLSDCSLRVRPIDGSSYAAMRHAWPGLAVPFSVLVSWMYTSLDRRPEKAPKIHSKASANDVPISQMCRAVEIDLREMLGETHLPPLLQPQNNIVL